MSERGVRGNGLEWARREWVNIADLVNYQFPEANVPILQRVVKEFS